MVISETAKVKLVFVPEHGFSVITGNTEIVASTYTEAQAVFDLYRGKAEKHSSY